MRTKRKIIFLSLLCGAFAFFCPVAGAEEASALDPQRIQSVGKKLLTDLNDQAPRDYFHQLAKAELKGSAADKMKIVQLSELIAYLDFLKQRLGNLTKTDIDLNMFGVAERKTSYPEFSVADIVARLSLVKDKLVEQIRQKQLESVQLKPKEGTVYKSEQGALSSQIEMVNSMRMELGKIRESFKDLQGRLTTAEQRVGRLTDDLAAKTMEVFEKEDIISRQKKELLALEQKFSDVKERFALGQQLLREKNSRIEALQSPGGPPVTADQSQGHEWNELLEKFESLQKQFDEQTKNDKARLSIVEGLLAEQEKRMAQYSLDLRAKGEQLDSLTDLVLKKSKEVNELNAILTSKDEKLLEMDGIISIYKDKLTETNKTLLKRLEEIKTLEEQSVEDRQNLIHSQMDMGAVREKLFYLNELSKRLP